jgi:outer membrane receptor protein involved in Fe transport
MKPRLGLFAFILMGTIQSTVAQTEEIQELDAFISVEVPVEESILPTTRPFNSVFGTDRSILETPRNVTIISREQLDAISIKTPRDFARLTSSSYTKSNFGAPTSPNLRGQEADLFVNGVRKGLTSNGNGLPINFNAVESVNIVKGPAGPVYGTSNYLGGFADLITKRAYFDEARGVITATVGSYDVRYWQVDYSTPISEKLAVRFSYSGEDSEGYFQFGKKKTQAFYATATYRPTDKYELFVAAEFFVADYTENWGINRPTQDLIDHGLYLPNRGTDEEYFAYISQLGNGDSVFGGGQAGVDFASQFGGAGFATIVPIDLDNPVKLDRSTRLLAPGDDSFGKNFWAQAIQTFKIADDFRIENNTYFQWIDRNTFSSYHYSELLRDNWSFDNRIQAIVEKDLYDFNGGLRFRYEEVWSVNHFFNEPVNFWDLTRPIEGTNRRVPDAGFAGAPYVPDQEPHGTLERWYYGGTGGDSKGYILGPFAQFTSRHVDNLIIDIGVGLDYVDASEAHPIVGANGQFDFNEDGDFDDANEQGFELEDSLSLWNYQASLTYLLNEDVTLYATYGFSETTPSETGGRFDVGSFAQSQESELLEAGAKLQLLEDKLFVGTAIVDRAFTVGNPDGSTDEVELTAFEFELNYQPNQKVYATFGYSYIDAKRTAGFFATGYTADRAGETGGFYVTPTFPGPSDPTQMFEYPGTPKHQLVALVSYKITEDFGVRANLVATGPMDLGYSGYDIFVFDPEDPNGGYSIAANTVEIPWQYELDLTAFYSYQDWEFKLTIFNATDEENWDAPNAGYGNGSVVAREPVRAEFTVKYMF